MNKEYSFIARVIAFLLSLILLNPSLQAQGIFVKGAGGVSVSGTNVWTGDNRFTDSLFFIRDDADNTKLLQFQLSGITTGTTRTLTVPNASSTLCVAGVDCSFSALQTFGASGATMLGTLNINAGSIVASNVGMQFGSTALFDIATLTSLTPDGPVLMTGTTSNSLHLFEFGDLAFDFNNGPCGTAACTNPQFVAHDKDQNVTNYQALGLSGLSGGFRVTLTEAAATAIVQIPIPAATGLSGELIYTVFAKDGTNSQVRSGRVIFSVVAELTVETCVLGTPEELDNTPGVSTLTATIACDTTPANAVNITVNATSSLTQTTLEAYGTVILVGSGEPLPQ